MPATLITNLGAIVATIPQIKRVYADPPDSISEFPCAMIYTVGGDMEAQGVGHFRVFHNLELDIYSNMNVTAEAIAEARIWPGLLFPLLAADMTLSAAAASTDGVISYVSGPMPYGTDMHYGVKFSIRYKMITTY